MSLFSTTSCSLCVALWAAVGSAQAQVPEDGASLGAQPSRVEAAIYLELRGHPDTASENIQVHIVGDRVELSGMLTGEPARVIARRMVAGVAPDLRVDDRMDVRVDASVPRPYSTGDTTPAELKRRFTDLLAREFPPEIMRELALTVYRVD